MEDEEGEEGLFRGKKRRGKDECIYMKLLERGSKSIETFIPKTRRTHTERSYFRANYVFRSKYGRMTP